MDDLDDLGRGSFVRMGLGVERPKFRLADVRRFLDDRFAGHVHAKRIASLANGTLGVMTGASLAVSMIGQALAQARGLLTKHAVKQVDRLLSNAGVSPWELFAQMGIPFTHVDTSDSVGGWKAQDIRSLGLITLGRFRSSTRGLAVKRRAVNISAGFAGRMALSAPTARRRANRGKCRAACCAVAPAIGRYR
jgi:predicted transcriptional regulator